MFVDDASSAADTREICVLLFYLRSIQWDVHFGRITIPQGRQQSNLRLSIDIQLLIETRRWQSLHKRD